MIQTLSQPQAKQLDEAAAQFCRLLKPPEKIKPSEWAERHRVLRPGRTREPGRWRNKRAPHLVGIMDAAIEPGVTGIVVVKGARVGYSEAWKNLLGYWIDCEPDPTMFVLPDKESCDKIVSGDIRPLLTETPKLARMVSAERTDNKLTVTRLTNGMEISTGWAGSAQSLASSNQRRVLFDETDKFGAFAGREADPISLGMARANTYAAIERAFYLLGSTPTTRAGHIMQRAAACTTHRRWHAPCPKCGAMQQVMWSQVKWAERLEGEDRFQHAARIAETGEVWYECKECQHPITETDKPKMMAQGRWVDDDPSASNRWICFHAPSYISLMISWAQIAEAFIKAQDNPALLMEVVNQYFGEPFEERASETSADTIREKIKHAGPPMVLPEWAQLLIATADKQKNHLYYVVRAWGYGFRSALVAHGLAPDEDTLHNLVFDGRYATAHGEAVAAQVLAIDAQYETDVVFAFAQRDPARIWPVRGEGSAKAMPYAETKIDAYPGVIRRNLAVNHWKNQLHNYITNDDETLWLPHNQVDDDYCRQMASEHKIHDRKAGTWVWQPISDGRDNHYWDCETYQVAIAQRLGVAALSDHKQVQEQVVHRDQQQASRMGNSGRIGGSWSVNGR